MTKSARCRSSNALRRTSTAKLSSSLGAELPPAMARLHRNPVPGYTRCFANLKGNGGVKLRRSSAVFWHLKTSNTLEHVWSNSVLRYLQFTMVYAFHHCMRHPCMCSHNLVTSKPNQSRAAGKLWEKLTLCLKLGMVGMHSSTVHARNFGSGLHDFAGGPAWMHVFAQNIAKALHILQIIDIKPGSALPWNCLACKCPSALMCS